MKKTILTFLTLTLISCNTETDKKNKKTSLSQKEEVPVEIIDDNQEFKAIDSDDLNQLLVKKGGDLSPKEVMNLFYPNTVETGEGNEKIELLEKVSDNGNVIVTLIHDNLLDDSVRGEKYIIELKRNNNKWTVLSIKKNWKCWNGRGHTDWGIEFCN
ncbi:hypothetical protein HME9304_01236 [Flagellimonas maritima]|uniref:Uncharacterized protein n=1 Tax=Flagellimonas maritima TaxID=1383885 RepID=A0A2Z4LQZ0_9FLAO|nr:hypothetical protein [Allomuricauda aurantiaca]AWX44236.1 hypothetical protein HME9304_01236 [Allomuricauda aurantiaca]